MELRTRAWHGPTLELFGVQPNMLPRICSNAQALGSFLEGPLKGVPITGTGSNTRKPPRPALPCCPAPAAALGRQSASSERL